ncbi:hypothetical protein [Natrinema saccharevitans]|uniref:hypothetical protein n=1 Tax=Natrinema saccharevitans TaxID=301967 RepID=UPI0011157DED|nr:hypothetical protein [Natrinema saccharevitans]
MRESENWIIRENYQEAHLLHNNGYIKVDKGGTHWSINVWTTNGDGDLYQKESPSENTNILDYTQKYRKKVENAGGFTQVQVSRKPHEIYKSRLEFLQSSSTNLVEIDKQPVVAFHLFCSKEDQPLVNTVSELPNDSMVIQNPTSTITNSGEKYFIKTSNLFENMEYICISRHGWIELVDSTYSDWRFPIERLRDDVINFSSAGLSYLSEFDPEGPVQLYVTLLGFGSVELAGSYAGTNSYPIIPKNIEGGYLTEYDTGKNITTEKISSGLLITNKGKEIWITSSKD